MTTGGDAPGMNAAIRAIVRSAIFAKFDVVGVERGYEGLIDGCFKILDIRSVSNIINKGGTILHTVRSKRFRQKLWRKKAYSNLAEHNVDAVIVIGGDGSLHGSRIMYQESGVPCIVIPATIDNDLALTDYTIGFDTAVNTAVDAIDKIRDTATSHERVFIVEVMGREHGFLPLEVGLVSGAEIILIPESKFILKDIIAKLENGRKRGKASSIIVMAEGAGDSSKLAQEISKNTGLEVRVSVLGHMQRGGTPSAFSRSLACLFGAEAVELLKKGLFNRMVGIANSKIVSFDIDKVLRSEKKIDQKKYALSQRLSI